MGHATAAHPGLAVAMLTLLAAAIALRWWVIASLGPHWNVAIMDSIEEQKNGGQGLTVVCKGPFRWIRHPNYLAVFLELLALPLLHAAWFTAVLGSAAHIWVLHHRVHSEEAVLLGHPSYQAVMADKPASSRGRFSRRPGCLCFHPSRPSSVSAGRVRALRLGAAVVAAQGRTIEPSLYLLGQASSRPSS